MFIKSGDEDTICALSTAPGHGGIAVVRVSGKNAFGITRQLCPFLPAEPESHRIYYGVLKTPSGENVDEVLVSIFHQGRSFTGEATAEISCHGGPVLIATILKELVTLGARTARRGEFTYRAFMNGRLDLVQAESVLSLIESQTRQSAKLALRQLQGHLSRDFGRIEDDLVWILAQLEASIDFSGEGIEIISSAVALKRADELMMFIETLIKSYAAGKLFREGLQVALVGAPNAGKSSLLNALLKEDRAIVTPYAGTTRDLVEGRLVFDGIPVTLVDTAGLRDTENEIERLGIERSRSAMTKSDLILYVIDLSSPNWAEEFSKFATEAAKGPEGGSDAYFVFNKVDLISGSRDISDSLKIGENLPKTGSFLERCFLVSALNGSGIQALEELFVERCRQTSQETSNVILQGRHLEQLQKIQSCLGSAIALIKKDSSPEFIAFELAEAVRAIHELLGKEFNEQVIDRIFKEFCLGK